MKTTLLLLITASLTLSSCYKSKCHTCTTKNYKNGIETYSSERKYCDKTRKEIKNMEGSYTNEYYDSSSAINVTVVSTTTCN